MKTKLGNIWETLRSGYWFLPAVMAAGAFTLSFLMVALDEQVSSSPFKGLNWLYQNKPDGAREVLSTIAGSMITVTGVVFSVTIVALSLASSQFGPSVLRGFMRDRANQMVLGTFISTFLYSLMVLRTIRGGDDDFVPQMSLTLGVLLAIASVGVLIFFIHHSAQSIQASSILERISGDLSDAIEKLYPEKISEAVEPERRSPNQIAELLPPDFDRNSVEITAKSEGYLQAIEKETLMEMAVANDLVIHVKKQPGAFIAQDDVLAGVWPKSRIKDEIASNLCDAFLIGASRTQEQDLEMPVRQLAEIAVRSLSPGINDPFTAMDCVSRLSAGLEKLAGRVIPSPCRYDERNQLRVLTTPVATSEMILLAFDQIILFGKSNPAVLLHVLKALAEIAGRLRRDNDRAAVKKFAEKIAEESRRNFSADEQTQIDEQFRLVMKRLSSAESK